MKHYLGNILALAGLFAILLLIQQVVSTQREAKVEKETAPQEEMAVVELKPKETPVTPRKTTSAPRQKQAKEPTPELDTAAARELYLLQNQTGETIPIKEYIPFENPLAYQQ